MPADLYEDAAGDLSARFEREAVAAAQINHPNVVALYDRGAHEGTLFLVRGSRAVGRSAITPLWSRVPEITRGR